MKYLIILLTLGLIAPAGRSADSLYIHQGIHGMKWGSLISEYDGLTRVHEKHHAAYYAKSNMIYYSANQPVSRVSYGFYRNRLYAAFIRLASADQFSNLAQKFTDFHGKPKVTYEDAGRQVVYRWIVREVKIKLKMKESGKEYKLAFYYTPFSDSLNQEQLDQIPAKAYGPPPVKDADITRSAPLLDY